MLAISPGPIHCLPAPGHIMGNFVQFSSNCRCLLQATSRVAMSKMGPRRSRAYSFGANWHRHSTPLWRTVRKTRLQTQTLWTFLRQTLWTFDRFTAFLCVFRNQVFIMFRCSVRSNGAVVLHAISNTWEAQCPGYSINILTFFRPQAFVWSRAEFCDIFIWQ